MVSYTFKYRPSVEAFDTETFNGYAYLLGSSSDHIVKLEGRTPVKLSTVECIDFIYNKLRGGDRTKIGFFFNIGFDFAAILKEHLMKLSAEEVNEFRKSHIIDLGRFKLKYIAGKGLIIKNPVSHKRVICYDIGNLLRTKEESSLEDLSQAYLNCGKLKGLNKPRISVDINYWRSNLKEIVKYCIRDANLTSRLAELFISYANESVGFYPRYYFSKASVSKAWLSHNHGYLRKQFMFSKLSKGGQLIWATKLQLSIKDLDLIYQSFWGGIFDTHIFGTIEKVSQLDISSAYPFAIANKLPKLNSLEIRRTNTYSPDAVTGFYKVKMSYPKYPMPYRRKDDVTVYPIQDLTREEKTDLDRWLEENAMYPETSNKFIHYVVKPKLDFFKEKRIPFSIIQGLEFFGKFEPEFPDFAELYEQRRRIKNQMNSHSSEIKRSCALKEHMLKIVMNACYGSMAELTHGIGAFTNLVYASLITTDTHLKIYDIMEQVGFDNVVAIATDSIQYIDEGQELFQPDGFAMKYNQSKLGNFKLEHKKITAKIYMNGIYFLEDKNGKVLSFRKRGLPSLTPQMLKEATGHTIQIEWERPIHMFEALASHAQEKIKDINVWKLYKRKLDLRENSTKRNLEAEFTFKEFNRTPVYSEPPTVQNSSVIKRFPEPKERWNEL